MKTFLITVVATATLACPLSVSASVPMDSFNSANAALVPSLAIDPKIKKGPAQALVTMAQKRRRSQANDTPPKP